MGMQTMQVQQPMQQSGGKGTSNQTGSAPQMMAQIGGQSAGQPRFGQPNQYSNTLRPWDNATIAPQYSTGGKGGKGGGMQSNYPVARTNWSYSLPSNTNQPQFQQPTSNASNVGYGSDYSGA